MLRVASVRPHWGYSKVSKTAIELKVNKYFVIFFGINYLIYDYDELSPFPGKQKNKKKSFINKSFPLLSRVVKSYTPSDIEFFHIFVERQSNIHLSDFLISFALSFDVFDTKINHKGDFFDFFHNGNEINFEIGRR